MTSILLELKTHKIRNRNKKVALICFFVLSIICVVADIFIGSQGLTFSQVIHALIHPQSSDIASKIIVWDIRMPMALMAPLIGGASALAGAQMQTTLNNPLSRSLYFWGLSCCRIWGFISDY